MQKYLKVYNPALQGAILLFGTKPDCTSDYTTGHLLKLSSGTWGIDVGLSYNDFIYHYTFFEISIFSIFFAKFTFFEYTFEILTFFKIFEKM